MKVKVIIETTKEEIEKYQKDFMEFNDVPLSENEIKNRFIENFIADVSDYLDDIRVEVY